MVLETNMPANILTTIVENLPDKKYILDTVSGDKAMRSKAILSSLYILKTNLLEAKILSGLQIDKKEDYPKLITYFFK